MSQVGMQKKIVEFFLEKNIFISSDAASFLEGFSEEQAESIYQKVKDKAFSDDFFVLTKEEIERILEKKDPENIDDEDNGFIIPKQENEGEEKRENKKTTQKNPSSDSKVNILFSYSEKSVKREVSHFVSYFRQRYTALEKMLSKRKELSNKISIARAKGKRDKEAVALIGMVLDVQYTKNNNIIVTLEDFTGQINVLVSKNKEGDLFNEAKTLVYDEIIGVEGVSGNGIIFANKIIFPDIPLTKELKKSPKEEYAAFLGDPHVGSKQFLKKEFLRFLNWIEGKTGDEKQKEIASKVNYLFIAGDIVDGVGIYPNQENDLEIVDIYEQYREFARMLRQVPKHIQIIICPGNHDAMRISEPQPPLYHDFAKEMYEMPNVHMVSSPSMVNIASTENFSGFDVLLYHGFSFLYYADSVEAIRTRGGHERADLVMELLLKKRHLAPSHTSNLYIPDTKKDSLIIEKIPDFFVSGHIHRTTAKNFNNITLLNCSCWVGQTPYQEKVGLKPQPARLPIINLQTREIKILKFGKDSYNLNDE